MIRHFLTGIYRNFLRNKLSSILNLTNLVVGFEAFILFSGVVSYELSYDKHNERYDRIYRVQTRQEDSYPTNFCTFSPPAFRYHLMAEQPEVEEVLLMHEITGQFFTLPDGSQLFQKFGYWSENSIFRIFTIDIKEGNKQTALDEPNTIAISETLAAKLFPDGNAVGKKVTIGKRVPLIVTAVYSDFPMNSNLRPSYLVSMKSFETITGRTGFQQNWVNIEYDNYVLLRKGADPELVNAKIKNAFASVKDYEKSTPYLHPLSKLHTTPNSQPDMLIGLAILSLAAILILVLSCVNYVNLSLANSTQRACEIGIKKVVGSSKKTIAIQFLSETMIFTLVAACLGLIAAHLARPVMLGILDHFNYSIWQDTKLLLIITGVSLLAGLLSGLYPSFVIAAYNPVKVLKGKLFNDVGKSFSLKKVLVTTQFAISLFMLIVSLILTRHVDFILKKDLGFENQNILFAELNVNEEVNFETIKNRLKQYPEIAEVTYSNTIPFLGNIGGYITWEGASPDEKVMLSRNYVNYDFIPTYGLEMVQGRNFSPEYPSDRDGCIINQTALKVFGWDEPIGKQITLYGKSYPVIGVVKDFHPFSVHNEIPTYVMFLNDNILSGGKILTMRFTPGNELKAKQLATRELEALLPNVPFELNGFPVIFYTDGAIGFWKAMKNFFLLFSVVSLIVSTLGLFGLMMFTIKRRTKEIGIRKVLGSSVQSIYRQLSFEIFVLLAFATLVACPAAVMIYKTMPGVYKEPLSSVVFILAIGVIAIIAQLTISFHVLKVAVSNPVEALRYE